jgi:glycosyltransferase involved in cell wall biosynthesis
MHVTVCICTHDRPGYVRDCLDGLRRQTVGDQWFDTLVIDSASTGDVPAQLASLIGSLRNARLLRSERPGVSVARNVGACAASGDYIAYIDDDAIPAPDWVERILAAIGEADRPPALIGGRILPLWEAPRCPAGGRRACAGRCPSSRRKDRANTAPPTCPPGSSRTERTW